jgi:rare lipoprotein A
MEENWPTAPKRVTEVPMNARAKSPVQALTCLRSSVISRVLRFSPLGLLWALGCGNAATSAADWPAQPNPSYPTPTEKNEAANSASTPPASPDPTSEGGPATATGAALAKKYAGAPALETLSGKASYYADSLAGNRTASGDIYSPEEFTCAHTQLAFGTVVRIVRVDNGMTTYARVNDRGPFGTKERIIDLSKAAANELEMMKAGVVDVRVELVETPAK